ncbi:efflux RND transporter periplasmic adaptor subunit [Thalassiella azotivora]
MRSVLLPVARLLVWTVIALALCVLAFGRGGDDGDAAGPLAPVAGAGASVVPVTTGDISSVVAVTGTVVADPATTVRSTATGTVSRLRVEVGDTVAAGDRLLDVEVQLEPLEGETVTADDGTVTTTPPVPRTKIERVTATTAGTVTAVAVLKGQDVSIGTDVVTVSPGTLSVSAPLTQSQQFRLLTPPQTASAQAPGGPAPFECTNLRTSAAEQPEAGAAPGYDPMTGMPMENPTAEVTCAVPAGTTVFAGMSVELTVDTGSVTGVLVLPVSAVLGTVGEGRVWVVGDDGESAERAVTLGLTDGQQVQVTGGLEEGEQVLEFTPAPLDDEMAGGPEGMWG